MLQSSRLDYPQLTSGVHLTNNGTHFQILASLNPIAPPQLSIKS